MNCINLNLYRSLLIRSRIWPCVITAMLIHLAISLTSSTILYGTSCDSLTRESRR